MKNKKLKYILIPLVIIVWGLVFYKVFNYTSDDEFLPDLPVDYSLQKGPVELKDTFSLSLDYKDPFLKKNRSIRTSSSASNSSSATASSQAVDGYQNVVQTNPRRMHANNRTVAKPQFKPTEISYGGEIINDNTKNATAVIKIKGKNKLLSNGDVVGDIEIIEVYSDSIRLKDQGVARTIKKN